MVDDPVAVRAFRLAPVIIHGSLQADGFRGGPVATGAHAVFVVVGVHEGAHARVRGQAIVGLEGRIGVGVLEVIVLVVVRSAPLGIGIADAAIGPSGRGQMLARRIAEALIVQRRLCIGDRGHVVGERIAIAQVAQHHGSIGVQHPG